MNYGAKHNKAQLDRPFGAGRVLSVMSLSGYMKKLLLMISIYFIYGCTNQPTLSDAQFVRSYESCNDPKSCIRTIKEVVESNWVKPVSVEQGMIAIINIKMRDDGTLITAKVHQSSGDPAYDISVIQAVKNSFPLLEIKGLNNEQFNKYYQEFNFHFGY